MKKTSIIIVVSIAILAFQSCKYFNAPNDKDFAIADTSSIYKIFLASKDNATATLERKGSGWTVNKNYDARQDAVQILLGAVKDIRVNRPVPINSHNRVVKEMASEAIKVELYNKKNELLKSYFVGHPTKDFTGDYFLMEGADQPYIVNIPNFEGWIGARYFTDELEWRKRTILALNSSQIKGVQVNYFDENRANSFELQRPNLNDFVLIPNKNIDVKKCLTLCESFNPLNAMAFTRNTPDIAVAKATPPFASIKILDSENKEHLIELIHMPLNRRTKKQYDDFGKPMNFDSDFYFAWVNNRKDFMIVQDFQLRNVLLKSSDLEKK